MKKIISLLLVFFLLIGFVGCSGGDKDDEGVTGNNDTPTPVSVTGNIVYDDEITLPPVAESFLKGFFDDVYRFMATWEDADFTKYFSDSEEGLICQYAMELFRDIRKNRHTDLKMDYVDYEIRISDVEEKSYGYKLTMFENYDCTFAFMDSESRTQNVYAWIGLEEHSGTYSLRFYDREEDFYYLILNRYDRDSGEEPSVQLEKICTEMLNNFSVQNAEYATMLQNVKGDSVAISCDVLYDRSKAVDYAYRYAFDRNSDEWFVFDDLGGNCQNFASQVLIEGGMKMDTAGKYIWKYFDSALDDSNDEEGRSSSWAEVNSFYEYAVKNNDGFVCKADGNIYTALPGDVIQMSSRTSSYAHTVVATGILQDETGNTVDIITASNTVDRYNFPLSAYNYPYFRLIQVYGYNNQ